MPVGKVRTNEIQRQLIEKKNTVEFGHNNRFRDVQPSQCFARPAKTSLSRLTYSGVGGVTPGTSDMKFFLIQWEMLERVRTKRTKHRVA